MTNFVVPVEATVQTHPPLIALRWLPDPTATGYAVYRKTRDASEWYFYALLNATTTQYNDATVSVGGTYEYKIVKTGSPQGEGYVYAGIQAPLVETRGKVLLLVDNTLSSSLSNELSRLMLDLVGDGWQVLRQDTPRMTTPPADTSTASWVPRAAEVADVKARVQNAYQADPESLKAVFIIGHIPVPYAGSIKPDGHDDHLGAWPADGYYGDTSSTAGTWTDRLITTTAVSDPRNRNVPGDGKFDQSTFVNKLKVQVGRVDFANLPAFSQNETELMRRYLNKHHNYRHKQFSVPARGWVCDTIGATSGEALAANAWRNFVPFFGIGNVFSYPSWLYPLNYAGYLWGYACGPSGYTSMSWILSTQDLASSANDPQVVFTLFFGSYFGDWDSQNNLMRASLASPTYTLSSVWSGRPHFLFHHMALGETIGFGILVSQNNTGTYDLNTFNPNASFIHISLMGDPTLRMHVVAPPQDITAVDNRNGVVELNWTASPDASLGYHVYRAPTNMGPYTRLTSEPITANRFFDPVMTVGNWYMVRALNLEMTPSGSYTNASQGNFALFKGLPPPNKAPLFNSISNLTLLEDAGSYILNISGISAGLDEVQELTLGAISDNTAIIPQPIVNYTSPDTNGTVWFTPVSNAFGSATITLVLSDDGSTIDGGINRSTNWVSITIQAVNDPPSLSTISNLVVPEDAGAVIVNLTGISAGPGESQTLSLSAASSNPGLVPQPVVAYESPNVTGTLTFKPATNSSGVALITVILNDNGGTALGGEDASTNAFTLTIMAVNDPPVLTNIEPGVLTYYENQPPVIIAPNLLASDVDSPQMAGASIRIKTNFAVGQDFLTFSNRVGITGSYDAANGLLTFTGIAPLSVYQLVLRSVAYTNRSEDPSPLERSLEFVLNDSAASNNFSAPVCRTIQVVPVNDPPIIVVSPVNRTNAVGTAAGFGVEASGTPPLTYQWRLNGFHIQGATNSTLNLTNVQLGSEGFYDVLVTNVSGCSTSAAAYMVTYVPLQITQQPASLSVSEFENAVFTVQSEGALSYQWFFSGIAMADATNAQLNIPNCRSADAGNYWVVLSGRLEKMTSQVASLNVLLPPRLTRHPTDVMTPPGASITFSAAAIGQAPLRFQWYKDGVKIPGATISAYTLLGVQVEQQGAYQVVVTNNAGSATSLVAVLTVNRAPVPATPLMVRQQGFVAKMRAAKFLGTDPDADSLNLVSAGPSSLQTGTVHFTNDWVFYTSPASEPELDSFSFSIADSRGAMAFGTASVTKGIRQYQSPDSMVVDGNTNEVHLRFSGVPGQTYLIEYSDKRLTPGWSTLTNLTVDAAGLLFCTDATPAQSQPREYRITLIPTK